MKSRSVKMPIRLSKRVPPQCCSSQITYPLCCAFKKAAGLAGLYPCIRFGFLHVHCCQLMFSKMFLSQLDKVFSSCFLPSKSCTQRIQAIFTQQRVCQYLIATVLCFLKFSQHRGEGRCKSHAVRKFDTCNLKPKYSSRNPILPFIWQ